MLWGAGAGAGNVWLPCRRCNRCKIVSSSSKSPNSKVGSGVGMTEGVRGGPSALSGSDWIACRTGVSWGADASWGAGSSSPSGPNSIVDSELTATAGNGSVTPG